MICKFCGKHVDYWTKEGLCFACIDLRAILMGEE